MGEQAMRIYAFEGSHEVYASESLAAAEGYFEAIDVENDEYVFFGDDGTVISPSVQDERVVLTPTSEKRPAELRERLRTFLVQPRVAMDLDLADDPAALADLLIEHERARRWPAWLRFRRPS
jgi:hypothetical protein